ncbi:MAG TPA: OsmC family peroxiredoxin [Terriglobales bacterium]|nr:OsmC family peroxiredoxin [Terriglobales bacterium]
MIRSAVASWKGSPAIGEGLVTTSSGVMSNSLYSFGSSSGNEPCTSPSEMLAAAVASCMSLMMAQEVARAGVRPHEVKTESVLTLQEKKARWEITGIELHVTVNAPGLDEASFHKLTRNAKARCPISHSLNVPVKLSAKYETVEHAPVLA